MPAPQLGPASQIEIAAINSYTMITIRTKANGRSGWPMCYINGRPAKDTQASRVQGENGERHTGDSNVRELLLGTPISQLNAQFLTLSFDFADCCHHPVTDLFVWFRKKEAPRID